MHYKQADVGNNWIRGKISGILENLGNFRKLRELREFGNFQVF
jgi:hypothetical protein